MSSVELAERLGVALAEHHAELQLLVLFGSRARGDERPDSDWDLGYLARDGFDDLGARVTATVMLQSDDVDLVDLGSASVMLQHRAATDGVCVFDAGGHDLAFRTRASLAWCDMEPVLRRAHDRLLGGAAD